MQTMQVLSLGLVLGSEKRPEAVQLSLALSSPVDL